MAINNKKLLVAGGGYADIPLILAAKELGYHVITSGNKPSELGHCYSDEYHAADFSDPDAMLQLAERLKIDAICACCNDFSAISSAYVAEQMGLPGHDSYEVSKLIHHKDQYREFASSNGIITPNAIGFSNIDDALVGSEILSLPIMIKPVDLTGGKGIAIVKSRKEARPALEKAFSISKAKRVVVEEFVEGSRHGYSAFLRNGKVVFHFSDNEHYFLNPFLVSAASVPSIVPVGVEKILCEESERIARLLSLKDGIFHIQYICHDNEPVIIEICRRAPGDLYIKFVEYATGVDYAEWIVRAAAGLDCNKLEQIGSNGFYTRHCVMSHSPGKVLDVVIDKSVEKNIIDSFMWWTKGDEIQDVMTAKLGIVFLKFSSEEEMLDKTQRLQELIHVEVTQN